MCTAPLLYAAPTERDPFNGYGYKYLAPLEHGACQKQSGSFLQVPLRQTARDYTEVLKQRSLYSFVRLLAQIGLTAQTSLGRLVMNYLDTNLPLGGEYAPCKFT